MLIDLEKYYEEAVEIRRYLHEHPEISNNEFQTSSYLKEKVSELELTIEVVDTTSFIAILDTGRPGKTLGLRTDIDALPIQEEEKNLKNKKVSVSKNENAMHACGHDAHMAILLTSMKYLVEKKGLLSGRIIFIFEQAEEVGGGIHKMVDHLKAFDMDAIYGNHVYAELDTGKIIINEEEVMSGATFLDMTIHGKSGHGSRPDLALSPIVAGSQIMNAWGVALANRMDPEEVITLGIGEFHSGSAPNIIPSKARISGTLRFFNLEEARKAIAILKEVATYTAQANRCTVTFGEMDGKNYVEPVINDPKLAQLAQNIVVNSFGEEVLVEDETWFASETFAQYRELCPTLFTLVGIKNEELGSGAAHHNEHFDGDETALPYAYGLMTQFAIDYLNS